MGISNQLLILWSVSNALPIQAHPFPSGGGVAFPPGTPHCVDVYPVYAHLGLPLPDLPAGLPLLGLLTTFLSRPA